MGTRTRPSMSLPVRVPAPVCVCPCMAVGFAPHIEPFSIDLPTTRRALRDALAPEGDSARRRVLEHSLLDELDLALLPADLARVFRRGHWRSRDGEKGWLAMLLRGWGAGSDGDTRSTPVAVSAGSIPSSSTASTHP